MESGMLQARTGAMRSALRLSSMFFVTFRPIGGMNAEYAALVTCRKCASWGGMEPEFPACPLA
jgi:hypothetical protein